MSSKSQTATAEPPAVAPPEEKKKPSAKKGKPKLLPPYAVVVLNDDEHTFQYVIETFRKVFGYSISKCLLLAMLIHSSGRAAVWTGPKEVAELKRDQIRSAGSDFYAKQKVSYPLGVVIEPLPQ
jgi:ATP-dependent Clp protease adaptor protein ClpS